jgi:hypothetical protein
LKKRGGGLRIISELENRERDKWRLGKLLGKNFFKKMLEGLGNWRDMWHIRKRWEMHESF